MSTSSSCLSFMLCKNKKKKSSKQISRSTLNISSLQEFISNKATSSTQTPVYGESEFNRNFTFSKIASAALGVNPSNRSTIAIKKTNGYFQNFQNQDKLETAESDLSASSIKNKLSYEAYLESSLSNNTFSDIINSKDNRICWNKKFSSANPSKVLANPFVASTNNNRPRVVAITPMTCLRRRLLPNILMNNQRKNDNMVDADKAREIWMDNFEGLSNDSLVNL